jgi:signal transduction histidine kinase
MKSRSIFNDFFGHCSFLFALLLDRDGVILEGNDRAKRFLQESGHDTLCFLGDVLREGQEDFLPQLRHAGTERRNVPLVFQFAEGSVLALDCMAACLGEELVLYAACTDTEDQEIVSRLSVLNLEMANMGRELVKKNLQLSASQKALETANTMKNTFLSIIAHDLRGSVGGISQLLEMLRDDYDTLEEEEFKQLVSLASHDASRTFQLLEDLLTWSRSQRGVIEFNPVRYSIRELVGQAAGLLQSRALEKRISITHDIPDSLTARLDPAMIGTVLRNLLSNALKFTPSGGSIAVTARQSGESAEVVVRDNGLGISGEALEKLFQVGVNHGSSRGTEGESGTGLGLVLCREFVEKHGGRIWAESTPGEGSTFFFSLPSA